MPCATLGWCTKERSRGRIPGRAQRESGAPAFFALVRGEGGGRVGLLRSLASPIGLLLGCAIRGFASHEAFERFFFGSGSIYVPIHREGSLECR